MDQKATTSALPQIAVQAEKDRHWYKDAIIYQLHIKAFFDSNDDGMGDFPGLTDKLDYVKDLGVNTIWLLPFYPSPLRDDGYDVADYQNVHPLYGTLDDFRRFVTEAHRRDLRVITELVINHTSDQHPWFQAARRAPKGSRERNFYVWSDTPDRYKGTRIIFNGTESSNWAWDGMAQQFYWHRFFSHQPDLNFDNPEVLQAVYGVMRFWLDIGVDGFRLDAIPYLCEREGTNNENLPETHAVLKKLRAIIDANYPNVLLLAEANLWPEDVREYFGDGDECHMAYHFPLMPRMYMAIALEERHPITEIMNQTPDIPEACQWAIFLRNHDELTLATVTSKERDYMYNMYAADERARIYLGIRRRLAPLLENDASRIKLMVSLLLSMPGSPVLYYGDEIGMGDNIDLGDRDGVRTPMQWQPEHNAGFSRADPQRLYLQPILDSINGYEIVNVEAQTRAPWSLLNWTRRMLAARKGFRGFGRGSLRFLRPANRKILAYVREYGDEVLLCVANLSRSAQPVELDLAGYRGRIPIELLGRTAFPPVGELPYVLTLAGYGFLWFRLAAQDKQPANREEGIARDELPVLVLFDGWASLFRDRVVPWRISMSEKVRSQLENEVLPAFVAVRRWYAARNEPVRRVELADHVEWKPGGRNWLVTLARIESASGETQTCFLPLALAWEDSQEPLVNALAGATIAKVRQQDQVGVLADALGDEAFVRELVSAVGAGAEIKSARGTLRFRPTRAFAEIVGSEVATLAATTPGAQSSNTIVSLGDRVFVKAYRRLQAGANPEAEIGRYLTDVARFEHCVPMAGSVEYVAEDGRGATLALIQKYVFNQGSAWDYTLNHLDRFFEEVAREPEAPAADVHNAYNGLMQTLGRRTAELHAAFARSTGDPAFDPLALRPEDIAVRTTRLRGEAVAALDRLGQRRDTLPEAVRTDTDRLLAQREALLQRIAAHASDRAQGQRTRLHGDYHLGQVLLVQNDFIITDFEGEPTRTMEERAEKQSPLKDVAGMLRSFDYAMHAALFDFIAERPEARQALETAGKQWQALAAKAFLNGYEGVAQGEGLALPRAEANGLLELFMLERAVSELRHEVDDRPEWLSIPANAILSTLQRSR
ncbi:MAG TPA: maltose alpha-D-glucosyltransferase [Casimicrobiaceae bacterium]|nr:maltose alpha-D-glucosyltransferase [Casimicrobiaceae bacterium]